MMGVFMQVAMFPINPQKRFWKISGRSVFFRDNVHIGLQTLPAIIAVRRWVTPCALWRYSMNT